MILWRNSIGDDENSSYGYRWFASKSNALQHAEDNPDLYDWPGTQIAKVFNFDSRNKRSIVDFLNYYCAYADNG